MWRIAERESPEKGGGIINRVEGMGMYALKKVLMSA